MPGIGMWEVAMLALVALLVFGPRRLPEIGRSLGRGIREFKGSIGGDGGDGPDADDEARLAAERART